MGGSGHFNPPETLFRTTRKLNAGREILIASAVGLVVCSFWHRYYMNYKKDVEDFYKEYEKNYLKSLKEA